MKGPPAEGFGPLIDPSQYKIKWLDVAYSNESRTQKLDIYLPEGKGPFRLLIAIHGGAWEVGDKNDGQVTPIMAVVKHGYAVASVNYRLVAAWKRIHRKKAPTRTAVLMGA